MDKEMRLGIKTVFCRSPEAVVELRKLACQLKIMNLRYSWWAGVVMASSHVQISVNHLPASASTTSVTHVSQRNSVDCRYHGGSFRSACQLSIGVYYRNYGGRACQKLEC